MKKSFKIYFAITLLFSILFTSCYDPIYLEIERDVEPEKATIFGAINSITRYTADNKEFLFVNANGGLHYKLINKNGHGYWYCYDDLPFDSISYSFNKRKFEGQQIIKVVADANYLYLLTASYYANDDKGSIAPEGLYLWSNKFNLDSDGKTLIAAEDWECIIEDFDGEYFPLYTTKIGLNTRTFSAFSLIQTNAPQQAHRKVYIRRGDAEAYDKECTETTYFELSDKVITKSVLPAPVDTVLPDFTKDDKPEPSNISSAVWYNGDILFFNAVAATTDETYEADPTRFYFGSGSNLYCNKENSSATKKVLNAGEPISCLATTKDSLLIGRANYYGTSTKGGLVKTTLINGEPGEELVSFDTNAGFQLNSSYLINTLVNATPDKTELESSLYSSIIYKGTGTGTGVSYEDVGLWSFYPERGNWNRE